MVQEYAQDTRTVMVKKELHEELYYAIQKLDPKNKLQLINDNWAEFANDSGAVAKNAFVKAVDESESEAIWNILKNNDVFDDRGKINTETAINPGKVNSLLAGKSEDVKGHVLGILKQAYSRKPSLSLHRTQSDFSEHLTRKNKHARQIFLKTETAEQLNSALDDLERQILGDRLMGNQVLQ